jgi:hypothetical protein
MISAINILVAKFINDTFDDPEDLLEDFLTAKYQDALNLILQEKKSAKKKSAKKKSAKKKSPKKVKDPNSPARPKSGYIIFGNKIRAEEKKKKNSIKLTEIAEKWQESKASEDELYNACMSEASEDKKRYNSEMKEYVPPVPPAPEEGDAAPEEENDAPAKKKNKSKSKKVEGSPKKPMNGYLYYSRSERAEAKERGVSLKTADIAKVWMEHKEAKSEDYKLFQDMAAADKVRYAKELKIFKKKKEVEAEAEEEAEEEEEEEEEVEEVGPE